MSKIDLKQITKEKLESGSTEDWHVYNSVQDCIKEAIRQTLERACDKAEMKFTG